MNNAIRNFNLDVIDHYSDTCFWVTDKGMGTYGCFGRINKESRELLGLGTSFLVKSLVRRRPRKREAMKRERGTEFRQLLGTERTQAREQDVWRVCDIMEISSPWFFPETDLDRPCKGLRERETSLLLGEFLYQGLDEM